MANLFTAVSAEQQEIVAGGADKFKLDDLIKTSFNQELFNITADVASNSQGGSVLQGFSWDDMTTAAEKNLILDTKEN
jgi:hypothetical protein